MINFLFNTGRKWRIIPTNSNFLSDIIKQREITLFYVFLVCSFQYLPVKSLDFNSETCSQKENTCEKKKMMTEQNEDSKPRLIVFDLDYTLWPFWVDTHVNPPFRLKSNGKVFDSSGAKIQYYPEVPNVLEQLHSEGYKLGIASRTGAIKDGKALVNLFGWEKYFTFSEIYPGTKTNHFQRFQEDSKVPFQDMLFFDDENRNIADVRKLGVTCILVENGVTKKVVQEGLEAFARNKRKAKG